MITLAAGMSPSSVSSDRSYGFQAPAFGRTRNDGVALLLPGFQASHIARKAVAVGRGGRGRQLRPQFDLLDALAMRLDLFDRDDGLADILARMVEMRLQFAHAIA